MQKSIKHPVMNVTLKIQWTRLQNAAEVIWL